jgi:hypothetical protein
MAGMLVVGCDACAGTVIVGLARPDGAVTLIERIVADPRQPELFGSSVLPIASGRDTQLQ